MSLIFLIWLPLFFVLFLQCVFCQSSGIREFSDNFLCHSKAFSTVLGFLFYFYRRSKDLLLRLFDAFFHEFQLMLFCQDSTLKIFQIALRFLTKVLSHISEIHNYFLRIFDYNRSTDRSNCIFLLNKPQIHEQKSCLKFQTLFRLNILAIRKLCFAVYDQIFLLESIEKCIQHKLCYLKSLFHKFSTYDLSIIKLDLCIIETGII